jgi:hypothetical protein
MQSPFQRDSPVGASSFINAPRYQRHQPEQTLLYQLVENYYPAFLEHRSPRAAYYRIAYSLLDSADPPN